MQLNLKAQLRYEQRDYANVTEAIEMRRSDTRLRTALTAAIPFNDHVQLTGSSLMDFISKLIQLFLFIIFNFFFV
jgi:hypothetical protein